MLAWRVLVALVFLGLLGRAALATPQLARTEGITLPFDDALWAREKAAPPSLLTFRCIAPICSHGNFVTFVHDERPLIAPGFAPFAPGAATGAAVDLRLQSLTPGARLLARAAVAPIVLGGTSGYRGVYDIEDRALAKTGAVILLLRYGTGTLEIRMAAPVLSKPDIAAFDALISRLELQN